MNPIISVIIPVYNVEKYLYKCIDSVLGQTYKELEIILVDDGSTDNSGVICDEYEKKDDRIKVIHKKNGGLSDARNCGLDNAIGEYIAFLDSDDWVDIDLYKNLYYLIDKYDADIAVCNFERVYSERDKLRKVEEKVEVYTNTEAIEQIYYPTEKSTQMIIAWNKLYKKYILKNMRFPRGKIHEDEFLTPLLLYRAGKVVYTNKQLIYYRQVQGSIMNSNFSVKRLDYLYALENRNKFLKEKNLNELYLRGIELQVKNIINYYYLVKGSNIEDKTNILIKLKKDLIEIRDKVGKELPDRVRLKIKIFNISPYLYRVLFSIKIRKDKLLNLKGQLYR